MERSEERAIDECERIRGMEDLKERADDAAYPRPTPNLSAPPLSLSDLGAKSFFRAINLPETWAWCRLVCSLVVSLLLWALPQEMKLQSRLAESLRAR
jgi:hypothetical protein